ncbi:MAG: hypothetical protein M1823_000562 [Watsoniomyces obsoletus]|nr:MAG: hypothetical protein M1823_000562 [Watsoniomyces obsoletus]
MDKTPERRSRRSYINLNHLSLAPLTTDSSSTMHEVNPSGRDGGGYFAHHHPPSYIQGKSAPTTPGILSRSPSSTRLRGYHTTRDLEAQSIPKSKSSSYLLPPLQQQHGRRSRTLRPLTTSVSHPNRSRKAPPSSLSTDWFEHTGAVLTSEARESKGQSWLISRASSTSVVAGDGDEDLMIQGGEDMFFADDEYSPISTRSQRPSRATSLRRVMGARTGSGLGSRTPTYNNNSSRRSSGTPGFALTPAHYGNENGFFDDEFAAGPDFVVAEEDEDGVVVAQNEDDEELELELELELQRQRTEDAEMEKLTGGDDQGMGIGLGKLVERVMSWGLSSSVPGNDTNDVNNDDRKKEGKVSAKEGEKIGMKGGESVDVEVVTKKKEEAGGEGGGMGFPEQKQEQTRRDVGKEKEEHDELDMAWFLSVATRTLLS